MPTANPSQTFNCPHCGKPVAVAGAQVSRQIHCPECMGPINLEFTAPPAAASVQLPAAAMPSVQLEPKRKTHGCAWAALIVIGFFFLLIILGSLVPRDPGQIEASEAYVAAVDLCQQRFPGARDISSRSRSSIDGTGGGYTVILQVDGQNAFGGPVRKIVEVKLHKVGDRWVSDSIQQY